MSDIGGRISVDSNLSSRLETSERRDSQIPSPAASETQSSEDGGGGGGGMGGLNRYEPFNSKWSVALGGGKPTSWSDATFDTEGAVS